MDENGKGGNTRLFGPFVEPPLGPICGQPQYLLPLPLFFFQFQKAPRRILEMPSFSPILVLFIPISLKSLNPKKCCFWQRILHPRPSFLPFCGPFPKADYKKLVPICLHNIVEGKDKMFFEFFGANKKVMDE